MVNGTRSPRSVRGPLASSPTGLPSVRGRQGCGSGPPPLLCPPPCSWSQSGVFGLEGHPSLCRSWFRFVLGSSPRRGGAVPLPRRMRAPRRLLVVPLERSRLSVRRPWPSGGVVSRSQRPPPGRHCECSGACWRSWVGGVEAVRRGQSSAEGGCPVCVQRSLVRAPGPAFGRAPARALLPFLADVWKRGGRQCPPLAFRARWSCREP